MIAPAIGLGREVVCDRYIDSTVAYQGAALGAALLGRPGEEGSAFELGAEQIERMNSLIVGPCVPTSPC